jgi:hypothetical protein
VPRATQKRKPRNRGFSPCFHLPRCNMPGMPYGKGSGRSARGSASVVRKEICRQRVREFAGHRVDRWVTPASFAFPQRHLPAACHSCRIPVRDQREYLASRDVRRGGLPWRLASLSAHFGQHRQDARSASCGKHSSLRQFGLRRLRRFGGGSAPPDLVDVNAFRGCQAARLALLATKRPPLSEQ